MTALDVLLGSMETAHWELGEAFTGLPDADLWTRPSNRLVSIGEIASHIAYSEAKAILGTLEGTPFENSVVRYYPVSLDSRFTMDFGSAELYRQVQLVHEKCKDSVLKMNPTLEAVNPHRQDWTWHQTLEYMAFHVAYHTGQIYALRHLMGHKTVDN